MRAAEVLRSDVRAEIDDVYLRQQVDAIALIVGELGAAWDELFATLDAENAVFERTLANAGAEFIGASGDPLRRHAALLAAVDRAIAALHEQGDAGALRDIRHGLAEAAELERGMLAGARERSGSAAVRRL